MRNLPPINPHKERIVESMVSPPKPTTSLEYTKPKDHSVTLEDVSKRILLSLGLATQQVLTKISCGDTSRETIGALRDCNNIYCELRKEEKEKLKTMSDEELEDAVEALRSSDRSFKFPVP